MLQLEDFPVGDRLAVHDGDAGPSGIELVVAAARPLGAAREPGARAPFALLLRGPAEPLLPQATYRLAGERIGAQDVFVVPVAQTADATDYEAVFT